MFYITSKETKDLLPTDILFQTQYWAQVKKRIGYQPMAFDIISSKSWGDILVFIQNTNDNRPYAYIPHGPEHAPDIDQYGPYLESISESLAKSMDKQVAFIRYDLAWESPYANEMRNKKWNTFPEPRIQELRMNMGTQHWKLKKSPMNMTVASSLVIDIRDEEAHILSGMKPKTRYNISLARRKGVVVRNVSTECLPGFYGIYRQTASRNNFFCVSYQHFASIFESQMCDPQYSKVLFLLAYHGYDIIAGAVIAISRKTANFLYGASSDIKKNLMGPYILHWTAILHAREHGCTRYDMGGVSPGPDSEHPLYGLYRFKTGFGGKVELRSGSWDYPINILSHNLRGNTNVDEI